MMPRNEKLTIAECLREWLQWWNSAQNGIDVEAINMRSKVALAHHEASNKARTAKASLTAGRKGLPKKTRLKIARYNGTIAQAAESYGVSRTTVSNCRKEFSKKRDEKC